MGNCLSTTLHEKETFSCLEQKEFEEPPPSANRKHNKQKAPVADGRFRHPAADASSATVTERVKSEQECERIAQALLKHFLFSSLAREHLERVVDEMQHFALAPNSLIFSQGQPGHTFFVIESGIVEVEVNGITRGLLGPGKSFGELALLHDSARTATVRTVESTTLWGIGRQKFRHALETINEQKYAENREFIERVPLFKVLTPSQKENMLALLVTQEFVEGQKIVIEGDPGDLFYIIKEGSVVCTAGNSELRRMGKGDFFGEQALLNNTVRTATVTACTVTQLLSLGRDHLVHLLGDQLQYIIYKNSQRIALEKSPHFSALTGLQVDAIIDKMQVFTVPPNTEVIPFGRDKGDTLWILLKGDILRSTGTSVSVCECIGDKELTGINHEFYAESYTAMTECIMSEISRDALEECLGGGLSRISNKNEVVSVFRRVQLFRALPQKTLEKLADLLKQLVFSDKSVIFQERDPANAFFIVKEGCVNILKDSVVIRSICENDYFGERSILLNENRTASATANGKTTLWTLNKSDFLSLVNEGLRSQLLKRMDLQDDSVTLRELSIIKLLGKGMFGNVFLSLHKTKQTLYALKAVQRSKIIAYEIQENILLERQILLQLDHPFIMKLVKTFKDEKRIYFLMEFVRGMDLFDVIRAMDLLSDDHARFYSSCLLLIVEHLHEKNIIYRDLKPENVMIDEEGYPKLIDFGTAKKLTGRTYTVVGTPHYMAPEVIEGKGYGLPADLWSIGIMIYEFVCGLVPFGEEEEDPFKIYKKVLEKRLVYPSYVKKMNRTKTIIEHLLKKNPALRGTATSLIEHNWFLGVNWDMILSKQVVPPYIPRVPFIEKSLSNDLDLEITREEMKDDIQVSIVNTASPGWDQDF